jgi:hypothetical protein
VSDIEREKEAGMWRFFWYFLLSNDHPCRAEAERKRTRLAATAAGQAAMAQRTGGQ